MNETNLDLLEIILALVAGLAIFLFAVNQVSDSLGMIAGERAKEHLAKFTRNVFSGIMLGVVITALLDSSSAVIIMTIVLVKSNMISFRQSMGVIMGANIGTTVSSQIIAFDIGKFSAIPMVLGIILLFISRSERVSHTAKVLLGLGMIFFGLYTMERAVAPLRGHEQFLSWMTSLENPVTGTLVGGLVTLIIQSSSATVGIAITLASQGMMQLPAGVAVMLGAELGTCSDTLLATIGASRSAVKTGFFHLIFNLLSIITGLLFFQPFIELVLSVSGNAGIGRKIANAHILFNTLGVLVFVWFLPQFEKLLNRIFPETSQTAITVADPAA